MKKTKATLIIGSLLLSLITGCSTTNATTNYTKKVSSNTEFRNEQEVEVALWDSLDIGAKNNARQFELLNDLTMVNRNDPETKNNLNLVKGIPADVQIQSKYHPQQPLTHDEVTHMIKEGDTGRTRAKNYAKILNNGVATEPLSAINVQNSGLPKTTTVSQKYDMSEKYANISHNTPSNHKVKPMAKQTYSDIKSTSLSPKQKNNMNINSDINTSKYLGMPSILPSTYQATNGLGKDTSKKTVTTNVAKAKSAVVKSAYNDFDKRLSLPKGKYEINELLATIAKETGYQLQIDDPKNIGQKLEVNISEPFKGSHADVLKAISSSIKGKNVGKLYINPNNKKIRIAYDN